MNYVQLGRLLTDRSVRPTAIYAQCLDDLTWREVADVQPVICQDSGEVVGYRVWTGLRMIYMHPTDMVRAEWEYLSPWGTLVNDGGQIMVEINS